MSHIETGELIPIVAAVTDPGQTRRHNEDYVGYQAPTDPGIRQAWGSLLVICDGVGGSAAGEVASERAVHRILGDYYGLPIDMSPMDRLGQAVQSANSEIHRENVHQPDVRPMGTTVVAAALLDQILIIAHVGDSL